MDIFITNFFTLAFEQSLKCFEAIITLKFDSNFPIAYEINSIITKAIPLAENRNKALEEKGYKKLTDKTITA